MKRGSIVIMVLQGDFGKPRPGLVVQSDLFADHPTVSVLPITTDTKLDLIFRVDVSASAETGLREPSQVMVDKVSTVPVRKIGQVIGRLSTEEMTAVDRALALFLGFA